VEGGCGDKGVTRRGAAGRSGWGAGASTMGDAGCGVGAAGSCWARAGRVPVLEASAIPSAARRRMRRVIEASVPESNKGIGLVRCDGAEG